MSYSRRYSMLGLLVVLTLLGKSNARAEDKNDNNGHIKKVFVIAMENHNWTQPSTLTSPQQIFLNPAAPFINSLVNGTSGISGQVAYATNYQNAGAGVHPSEPNYIWAEAGSNLGVTSDNDPTAANNNLFTGVTTLTDQMDAAGITWKNYQEDVQHSSSPAISASGSGTVVNAYNGSTQFGDSVIELNFPTLTPRQAYTPVNQARLSETDTDLGSGAPTLLGGGRVMVAGKDGIMRVLSLSRLDGRAPRRSGLGAGGPRERLGGELQTLPLPGGGMLFTAPAVWRQGAHTTMFVAGEHGTGAYALRSGRLHLAWQNGTPGTSPVLAGGLLYVYDPEGGEISVYEPRSPHPIAHLPGAPGHWNSPIVVDGHVLEPEGNGNDHALTGTLDLFSATR